MRLAPLDISEKQCRDAKFRVSTIQINYNVNYDIWSFQVLCISLISLHTLRLRLY